MVRADDVERIDNAAFSLAAHVCDVPKKKNAISQELAEERKTASQHHVITCFFNQHHEAFEFYR